MDTQGNDDSKDDQQSGSKEPSYDVIDSNVALFAASETLRNCGDAWGRLRLRARAGRLPDLLDVDDGQDDAEVLPDERDEPHVDELEVGRLGNRLAGVWEERDEDQERR